MGMEENEGGVSVNPGLGFGAEPQNQVIKDLRDIYETVDFIKKRWCNEYCSNPCLYDKLSCKKRTA